MPKTKAETAFTAQSGTAITDQDWPALELAFTRYGTYLELVGLADPVGEELTFSFAPRQPEPFVPNLEPWTRPPS